MDELSIHIALNNGDCTTLYVFARRKNTLFKSEDAKEYGESPFQLQEGCMYDFELDKNSYYLQEDRDILTNSKSRQAISRGCISTGIYVGTYSIDVLQKEDNKKVGEVAFEIRSAKVGYRDDYRRMLEDITEFCTELLMQQSSPVIQRYEVDITKDPRSDYQRFAFVRSLVDSDSFADAMYQIQLSPVKRWIDSEEERQLCNVKRWGQHTLRQLARATNRVSLSNQHPLKDRFDTLPRCVPVAFRKETADIPENRFIKYVLRSFLTFCSSIQHHSKAGQRLKQEASLVCEKLLQYLSYPLFRNISEINVLPLNSSILQRKEGYREIFQKWLMFDMAARLTWQGGEDVYGAGKKDVARLYEYWLFFKLLDVLSQKFHIPSKSKEELIDCSNELNLTLKQGKMIMLSGIYETDSRKLNICFSYNRTFSYTDNYQLSGSWTRNFRPDYTLTIWPGDIASEEAEREELITHIHFDAKYRIEQLFLRDNTNKNNDEVSDDLSEMKREEERGTYKRADLLKMHAYKDAIRRTGGAYILYPGTENQVIHGFHEIIPGLGAFAISPKDYDKSIQAFLTFLDDVVDNFLNRTSLREKLAYHTYSVLSKNNNRSLREPLPEPYGANRDLLPDETYVLIGYYKNEQQLDWILKRKLYNTRTGSTNGSLHLSKEVISVRYLLLHGEGELLTGRLYKLLPKGPRIFSKEKLEKIGYKEPSGDYYLVYNIEGIPEPEFEGMKWDIRLLEGYKKGNLSASVFAVSLADLMKIKVFNEYEYTNET